MNGAQPFSAWMKANSGRVALVASLGLNLFFAGWLVGARVVPWGFGPPHGPMQQISDHLRHRLSDEGYRAVSRLISRLESRRLQEFERTRAARDQIRAALVAPTFDRDALAKALNELNSAMSSSRSENDQSIIAAVASLSAEDRRRLADLPLPPPPPGPGVPPFDRPPPR